MLDKITNLFAGFNNKGLLGLDIGSSSIKIAEMSTSRKGFQLDAFGMIPTPPQATSGGDIVDPTLISEAVRMLLDEVKSKRKGIATGLWGASVIVKRISIPKMEESLIKEQIRWEAEQYIPYDINEVNLDYKILKLGSKESDTMDILLIAAMQQMIFNCAEIVSSAGMNCSVLDVEGFALANCFEVNYGVVDNQLMGLLNIGSSVTNFVVLEQGEVIFCRDIPIGGIIYTNELAKSLGMSLTEAEGIKLAMATGQAVPENSSNVIESTHDMFKEEIGNAIDFFHNTSGGQTIGKLHLTGGGSKTLGLYQALGNIIPCERLNPFQSIKANTKLFSQEYLAQIQDYCAISMGLGLRNKGDA